MRKIYNIIFLITISLFTLSCKKEKIEIETLSKAGGEFYYGEKVPVWAGTQGDLDGMSYEWKCTDGYFDGWRTQNLFENLWIAPNKVGEYTVTATAKNGSASSSRSMTMKVARYYFDEFENNYTLNGAGWSQSNTSQVFVNDNDPNKSRIELTASSTSGPNIRRSLNLADLKIPFSIRTKLGWKGFFRSGQAITISLYFKQPTTNPAIPYLREIRWEIWPTANPATADNYQIRYETFIPANSTSSKFSSNDNTAQTLPNPLPLINPVKGKKLDLSMADGVEKNISFSIDENNVFYAYVDGVSWFESNGIKDWLTYCKANYPNFEDPIAKEFRVAFPAKANSNEKGSTVFLNSVYINDDGEILK